MNQSLPFNFITTPFQLVDSYKIGHLRMHKSGTTGIYGNLTPRKSNRAGIDKCVFFGLQAWLMDLNSVFDNLFFNIVEDEAVKTFDDFWTEFSGKFDQKISDRVRGLHKLGYLPLMIKALPEGSAVNHNVPMATLRSTHEDFFWFEQWVETWLSNSVWRACTSSSTAMFYRKIFNKYNALTSDIDWITNFQMHDFSARGMGGFWDASVSGAGHAIFSQGSDTLSVLPFINKYYPGDNGLVVTSVFASEHSVQCGFLNSETNDTDQCDYDYIDSILNEFPDGIVSIVLDGFDFWASVTRILPKFKERIMARDGKIVIRPDSSPKTPVEIIIGDNESPEGTPENKGLVQCLYEIFGGTKNSKGYIDLDSHISCIYGDNINLVYADRILSGLMDKGFSSNNVVLGIGSASYIGTSMGLWEVEKPGPWGISRDSHGFALKATAVSAGRGNEQHWRAIFKDPKTDTSGKKSARGFLKVVWENNEYVLYQNVSEEEEKEGALEIVYLNGKILRTQSFADIRKVAQKFL